jgi:hypothetical protein
MEFTEHPMSRIDTPMNVNAVAPYDSKQDTI